MRTSPVRPVVRLMVGLAVVFAVLGGAAAPASAHAELVSSEPSSGELLESPPTQVVLHFSEGVDPPSDAIEAFDSSGDQLDVGDVTQADGGRDVMVTLPEIDDGAYVVTWRVTSSDSHPIRGGFTFRVGEGGDDAEAEALMEELLLGEGGDTAVGVLYGMVRFLAFAGMVLLVGGALFLVVLWPQGGVDRRVRRLLGGGWLVVLVATILGFGLQAAYAAGESLGGVVDAELLGEVFDTRVGRVWLVRLVLLGAVLLAARWLLRSRSAALAASDGDAALGWRELPSRWGADAGRIAAVAALGLALLATITLAGHAGAGDVVPLAVLVDVVHLTAVSFWLGGLALLVVAVLRTPSGADADDLDADDSPLHAVVGGFSTLAFAAVVTIVVTGIIQGTRQTQGISALFDTTYGRVLIVKVLVFAALVAVAAFSRQWVRRRWPPTVAAPGVGPGAKAVAEEVAQKPRLSPLRRSVALEAGIAAVVLAITALLVNTVPAVDDFEPTFSAELHSALVFYRVEVEPAVAGVSDVTIETMTHFGEPLAVEGVTASLLLPSRDIGPIPLQLEPDGTAVGRYVAADTDIPLSGAWELTVTARLSQFEEDQIAMAVPVR